MAQNWTTDASGEKSAEFNRVAQVVADLIEGDHFTLSNNPANTAVLIVAQLAHAQGYMPKGYRGEYEWTVNTDSHRSNSSSSFEGCVGAVTTELQSKHYELLTHREILPTAERIMKVLADNFALVPPLVEAV